MAPRTSKHADDPLCPIRGDRVRAALERSGWTVLQLAKRVGTSSQRLDLIVHGTTSRCRRSLRAKIAKALATSVQVLADEPDNVLPPEFYRSEEAELSETPIAQRILWQAVCKAAARDRLPVESDGFPRGFWHITRPEYWRSKLLSPAIPLDDLSQSERDRLGAMTADALMLALKPWFDGRAKLKAPRR